MREGRLLRIGREVFLAALGLPLETVDSWVIDRLTSILDEVEVKAGQRLFTAGQQADFLYFMRDGEVRFTRDGGPSWTLRGRWIIGGFEVLGDRPSGHTVTALGKNFYGMRVPAVDWVEMLEDSSQLARSAVVNSARALMRIEERVPAEPPLSRPEASLLSTVPPGELSLVDRLALLVDVRVLRAAGVQALADLAAASQQVSFATGEAILEPGIEPEHLIRIVDGEVIAERDDPALQRRYGPRDLVCGTAVLGRVSESWRARATAPTRAISFPIEALFDLMEEHFDLVRSTLAALGERRELLLEHLAAESADLILV